MPDNTAWDRRIQGTKPVVAVVIPCYRVKSHVKGVINSIPPEVNLIFCVDDACPEGTADFLEANCKEPRLRVLRHLRIKASAAPW